MSHTITVRLDEDLAEWLARAARRAGVSQGRIVRDELEKLRKARGAKAYMRWAGAVSGPSNLSSRKGFSKR
jgi:predicted transcriptional regulator